MLYLGSGWGIAGQNGNKLQRPNVDATVVRLSKPTSLCTINVSRGGSEVVALPSQPNGKMRHILSIVTDKHRFYPVQCRVSPPPTVLTVPYTLNLVSIVRQTVPNWGMRETLRQ